MTLMIITVVCGIALAVSLLYPRKPIVDNTKLGSYRPDAKS